MNIRSTTTATALLILFCAIAPAQAQQPQRRYAPGEGPTDRFLQVLGLVAQVAPAFLEGKATVRVAKIQARSADYATRGNVRIAQINNAGQVRVARISARATRYVADSERRSNVATAVLNVREQRYKTDVEARESAAERAVKLHELNSNNRHREQTLQLQREALYQGIPVSVGE